MIGAAEERDMKILIIIPAFNEEENILNMIKDLDENHPEYDRIVINDASEDATKDILVKFHIDHIDLPVNLGIGGGVQTGYLYAFQSGYDIAVQMDGDGQHCASELDSIIQPILKGEANIVVGSRFISREGFQSSFLRRLGIGFLSNLIHLCTGKRVLDVTSGFRAVDKNYIKIFAKEYAPDYPEPEALIVAAQHDAKILEVPVIMKDRENGKSSISAWRSVYYMVKVSLAIIIQRFIKRRYDK